ncbi:hypothetical protein [Klebsiella pneumoniae]|uniref:hypothetical protein n=1 Tax=Klebsiella pneumoniae TaxID=573 RepID=UPI0023F66E59|nr:hypothetical protein [Klebsiella pneumoniae]MDF7739711.1 hypothetical protein [Klebsiella pneumoniae]
MFKSIFTAGILLTSLLGTSVYADNNQEKESLPDREILLSNFDKMDLVKAGEWKQGKVVNGKPVLTARFDGDIYSIGSDSVGAVSLAADNSEFQLRHTAAVCANMVVAVTGKDDEGIYGAVGNVIAKAGEEKGNYSDLVDGYMLTVDIKEVGGYPALMCKIEGFARWD